MWLELKDLVLKEPTIKIGAGLHCSSNYFILNVTLKNESSETVGLQF